MNFLSCRACQIFAEVLMMIIRNFKPDDAEACFRLRSNAFIQKFHPELSLQEITSAVNSYLPNDYVRMAEEQPFFIAEENDDIIGFFNLLRVDKYTAQFPQLYIDLKAIRKGIGSACIQYMENWLSLNWKEVNQLIVDTVIPRYNRTFYEKMGFVQVGDTYCEFMGRKLKALRLRKNL